MGAALLIPATSLNGDGEDIRRDFEFAGHPDLRGIHQKEFFRLSQIPGQFRNNVR
jgi:hypothetical protein